ncbi:DNA alkylation repair protein [Agromyces silvae]|uniref:DNA alkylation repair protein n=1 Tax=Agromyces silvae TaxID=3388266 RepID=UPI00280AF625|nr:DNA alkylation repair protein [Agromyces protaetiae]
MISTADALIGELRDAADPEAFPNRHYRGGADVLGVRMGTVFEISKRRSAMDLGEVERLLEQTEYEPRLAAFCVLDFQVRRPGMTDGEREQRYRLYLDRHEAIDSWDMVDRAAPRVVGGYLRGRSRAPLFELAASGDPLRRRTAMTAPLAYTRPADVAGIADLLRLAELLAADPDPLVSKPVGIALKHAGAVAPDEVRAFLDRMGDRLPAPVRREAGAKLPAAPR